jgi:pilus assembly protein FimV
MGAGVSSRWPIALSSTLALALAVAAGPASALGLGQLQVKSKPGQPLVAEIPIISSDPSELQGLQVQLASPETFRRVGLEPPQGIASSLRFEPALDAGGRPVIRVTSAAPVQQPLLTFLLEVDWGQGRLVREYSALLDAPRTVASPVRAPIQAPVVAPSNTIVRAPTPIAVAPRPTPAPTQSIPAKPTPSKPVPAAPAPAVPPPAATSIAAVAPPSVPAQEASGEYGPVRAGQTLGQIAAGLEGTQGYSLAQTMLALLRANPDAFIGGNINQLKRGAVLRIPPGDELARLDQRHAAALVHEQITQWREARRPLAQPSTVATGAQAAPVTRKPAAVATAKTTRTADARLEIVPPSSAAGRQAGAHNQANRSGIEAGGEGEMLRQQLQETKETLAARDAEVGELKSRVAELEKLQQQQQQLLTMKDSALAAAQQRLASSNQKATAPVAVTATTQAQPPPAPTPEAGGTSVWLWGGLVLLLTALIGWLLSRRRPAPAPPRRSFDTETLAAGMVTAPATGRGVMDVEADPKPAAATTPGVAVPPWHEGPVVPELAAMAPTDAGEQLELAQKYLDLGDDDAARALLRDVLNGRDPAARDRAARLLRDL